jgi:uncharacterized protein (DUF169 family)
VENNHPVFSNQFRDYVIRVKFYKATPGLKNVKKLNNVRFCEAVFEAAHSPIILDKDSINCMGARYVFGWIDQAALLSQCGEKIPFPKQTTQGLLQQISRLKSNFESIGFNTDNNPDLIISRVTPQEAMVLIDFYHRKTGKTLDMDFCCMMSICGGIAVKTYLEDRITFSFGCKDSRKHAKISRDQLVLGLPKSQFDLISYQNAQ